MSLDAAGEAIGARAAAEPDAALEALDRLSTAERFLLLLRYQAGFSHLEVARLLGITEEAARKRTARARAAFLRTYRAARSDGTPLVVLLVRDEAPEPYIAWLEHAGARVRQLPGVPTERDLVLADALVTDRGDPRPPPRPLRRGAAGGPRRARHRDSTAPTSRACAARWRSGSQFAGVCRGHQLLNIATGGTLYQDVVLDGLTGSSHDDAEHRIDTPVDAATRRMLGASRRSRKSGM